LPGDIKRLLDTDTDTDTDADTVADPARGFGDTVREAINYPGVTRGEQKTCGSTGRF
jgi:hypothetical protein